MKLLVGSKINIPIRIISLVVAVLGVVLYLFLKPSFNEKMSSNDNAQALFEKFWDWRLKESPEFATFVGNHKFDDCLESYSLPSYVERMNICKVFLDEAVILLSGKQLNEDTQLNMELFISEMKTYIVGMTVNGFMFPMNYLEGVHVEFERVIQSMKFVTSEDYGKLLARYRAFPKQVTEIIELMRAGMKLNMTNHLASMHGVLVQIDQLIENIKDSGIYSPLLSKPENIPLPEWKKIVTDVQNAINLHVVTSFKRLRSFLEDEYFQNLRPDISISSLPLGEEMYQQCLNFHLGFHITPQEVHEMGLDEVKRITEEMEKVIESLELKMTVKKFSHKIRDDKDFYFTSKDDLLEAYKGLVFNKIQPKLPEIIKHIPKLNLSIIPTPQSMSSGPAAYYLAGTPDGRRPGVFYVNTARLNASPKYEMMTLALHEAEPGHHLQISYMMEQHGVPEFRRHVEDRKYSDAPSRFPLHTAYIEGWGLYSEFLGYEMEMYEDLYFLYGHLSHEIFRACRLVVDTGIHSLGWTREQAVQYMLDNTASHQEQIENEVNRYITWPGQACAYKVGEIKIKQLRKKAETALGPKFDLRDFHDVVLRSAGPLNLLEKKIEKYIQEQK